MPHTTRKGPLSERALRRIEDVTNEPKSGRTPSRNPGGDSIGGPMMGTDRRPEPVSRPSLADSQAVDHFKVLLPVVEPQVFQQARPLGNHHQQPAAAGMV